MQKAINKARSSFNGIAAFNSVAFNGGRLIPVTQLANFKKKMKKLNKKLAKRQHKFMRKVAKNLDQPIYLPTFSGKATKGA